MPFSTLKTLENLTVFWYFQGVEKGCIGLIYFSIYVTARKCKGFSCSTGRIFNFLSKQHAASVKLQQKRKQTLEYYGRRKKDCSRFHWEVFQLWSQIFVNNSARPMDTRQNNGNESTSCISLTLWMSTCTKITSSYQSYVNFRYFFWPLTVMLMVILLPSFIWCFPVAFIILMKRVNIVCFTK